MISNSSSDKEKIYAIALYLLFNKKKKDNKLKAIAEIFFLSEQGFEMFKKQDFWE